MLRPLGGWRVETNFRSSFARDLSKIRDEPVLYRVVKEAIERVEAVKPLDVFPGATTVRFLYFH